ncbi:MAG: OmpA family protein [Myxococcota bacterium]|nr:OmpA family protein [Myxococcota bacterium]
MSVRRGGWRGWLGVVLGAGVAGCASPPAGDPPPVTPIEPGVRQHIGIDAVLYVLDASSSMELRTGLWAERRLLTALASAMPEGGYGAGLLVFGGGEQQRDELEAFQRLELVVKLAGIQPLGGDTRLASAIDEVGRMLLLSRGRRAVILITDGVAKRGSDSQGRAAVLRATDRLLASRSGEICIHAVQVGDHPAGASLLRQLAAKSPCGSYRSVDELATAYAIQRFERSVFLTAATTRELPQVSARSALRDADRDGVVDERDRCTDSPFGVVVDSNGCWPMRRQGFGSNSSWLTDSARHELRELREELERHPDIAIRVIGHADSTGEPGYNAWLSERRAESVRGFLVEAGIDSDRIAIEAIGDSRPRGGNDTADGRALNRRTEIELDRR